jgi:hypothetical protein
MSEYNKKYYNDNKETIARKAMESYQKNKEFFKARARDYYHQHKYDPTYSHYLPDRLELQRKRYKKNNPNSREYFTQRHRLLIYNLNGKYDHKINRGEYTIKFE